MRNCDDGSVEILMRGDDDKIEKMISRCYNGPLWARVDEINFKPSVRNYFLPMIIDGVFERI